MTTNAAGGAPLERRVRPLRVDNEPGKTMCIVRYMVETDAGWLGAWDEAAFEAYVRSERDAALNIRAALEELRDRIKAHPVYANLTEEEEIDEGGDTAELSYLARVADAALGPNE